MVKKRSIIEIKSLLSATIRPGSGLYSGDKANIETKR